LFALIEEWRKNMKNLLMGLFLVSVLVCIASTVVSQDMPSLRKNAEDTVKAKNPAWRLITKQERGKEITYQWGNNKADVTLTIFYGTSQQEAIDRMKRGVDSLSVGPGKELAIGDEAYLWKTGNGFAGIRFRKANVYIDLSGSSVALVEDLARKLANHVQTK
jgi:hypothetical protein